MTAHLVLPMLAAFGLVDGDDPPASYVYESFGERTLQLAAHYPPGWKAGDKRPGMLLFSGAHKVRRDAQGNLPPLADERKRRGLPVTNPGPGDRLAPLADHFAMLGLVCFRVEYRTRNRDGVLPGEEVADAVQAIRWIRSHADTLGVDPERIVSTGSSSGGYLAASLFALDHLHPRDEGPPVAAEPNAMILLSPLVDWLEVGSMSDEFLIVLGGDKERGARISPARFWRKEMPPTLIMVGSEEPQFASVKKLADTWQARGAPMELFVAEGGEHGFFGRPAWLETTFARCDAFLRSLGYLDGSTEPRKTSRAAPTSLPQTVTYKTLGERTLHLAFHSPPGWKAEDRRPALLCLGGGGENPNDKSGQPYPLAEERRRLGLPVANPGPSPAFVPVAEHFAGLGMVAIRVEYRKRKTDGVLPGDAVADASSAIRWVRAHADDLGVDPGRIVVCGSSSGGHLAASLAALEGFDGADDDLSRSRRPDALILHSPLLDFLEGGTRTTPFLAALDFDRELGERLSPARHWSKDMPPTLLFTGEKEPIFRSLSDFAAHWKAAGQPIELVIGKGGHVGPLNDASLPQTLERIEAFLESIGYLDL